VRLSEGSMRPSSASSVAELLVRLVLPFVPASAAAKGNSRSRGEAWVPMATRFGMATYLSTL
jgi:hypothetical protein